MEHIPIGSGPSLILPEFSLRSRREQPVRDLFNARQYEHWNSDVPGPEQNFTDSSKQTPHYDMNPINTRTVERDYRQAQPFVVDGKKTGANPYFQKFDTTRDPRNVAREMLHAVYEYNAPRDQTTNNKLLYRNFESMYIPESQVKASYEKAIDIYAGMRPIMNNMKAVFR
uniref:Uncharacterized protein n=1 Tax=viral metagenome TaxID=1070528 RepID=A0A6C0HE57_9ZZZZ